MKDGFVKIACATPDLRVADCAYNGEQIVRMMREAAQAGAALTVFPELCITGYTCLDLFLLWNAAVTVQLCTTVNEYSALLDRIEPASLTQ